MAYLRNLSVKKVSFVRNAANKRDFILLKSVDASNADDGYRDSDEDGEAGVISTSKNKQNVNQEPEGDIRMGDQNNKQTSGTTEDVHKDKEAGKGEDQTNTTDTDVTKTATSKPQPQNSVPDDAIKKAIDAALSDVKKDLKASQEENAKLRSDIEKAAEVSRKRDIREKLEREAPFAPIEIDKAVKQVFDLEKAGFAGSAEDLVKSFVATSKSLEESETLTERGSSRDDPGGDVIRRSIDNVKSASTEIQKSADASMSNVDIVRSAIANKLGERGYDQYRKAFNRRARLG